MILTLTLNNETDLDMRNWCNLSEDLLVITSIVSSLDSVSADKLQLEQLILAFIISSSRSQCLLVCCTKLVYLVISLMIAV